MEEIDAEKLRYEFRKMTEQPVETGYLGPGIWIRVTHRFRTRMTEWLLAVITALWGAVHAAARGCIRPAGLRRLPVNLRQ
jgi:hypothetical protein